MKLRAITFLIAVLLPWILVNPVEAMEVGPLVDGLTEGRLFGMTIGECLVTDDPRVKESEEKRWGLSLCPTSTNLVSFGLNLGNQEIKTSFRGGSALLEQNSRKIMALRGDLRGEPLVIAPGEGWPRFGFGFPGYQKLLEALFEFAGDRPHATIWRRTWVMY